MGIGYSELLLIAIITVVIFSGIQIPDLFAYAYKYRGLRVRTRAYGPDNTRLIVTVIVLLVVAKAVFAIAISAN